ncbi:MAG: hypothetical protein K1X64_13330 [Myxococcaceae bacterium]|nr:hypothetical protein [Myxococcaceae bacterium]
MTDSLTQTLPQAFVPSGYAEKAMASLMQLHSELMDEKERRVDLYRRLMERDQVVAELRAYVKLLEAKLPPRPDPVTGAMPRAEEQVVERPAAVEPLRVATPKVTVPTATVTPRAPSISAGFQPAMRPPTVHDARFDGWKQW